MSEAAQDQSRSEEPVFFDAVLAPHRSLPPKGFVIVMALLGGASFLVSLSFVLAGAWPVTGFFGLDVLLVYLAFRLSYRRARIREHVRLTPGTLEVERIGITGERRRWRFEPFWLRIIFEERDEDSNRLMLASHGRALSLASFLGAAERKRLAEALTKALARWRLFAAGRG